MARKARNQGSTNADGVKWGKVKENRLAEVKASIEGLGESADAAFRAFAGTKSGTPDAAKAFRVAVDAAVSFREAVAEKDDLEKSIAHDKLLSEVRGLSNADLEAVIARVKAETAAVAKRTEEHRTGKANPEVPRPA